MAKDKEKTDDSAKFEKRRHAEVGEKNAQKKTDSTDGKSSPGEKTSVGGAFFGFVRTILILALAAFLIYTVGKDTPKVRALMERFTAAQSPDAGRDVLSTSGESMGTFWNAKIARVPKDWDEARLAETVRTILDRIDGLMSTYKEDSEISRFNRSESTDWFEVSPETAEVVALSLEMSEITGGAFDVTVGPLVNLWRFGPDKVSLEKIPTDEEIDRAKAITGYRYLQVRIGGKAADGAETPAAIKKEIPNLYLDLSAVAKGWSVDSVAETLEKEGIKNYLIDVGGELRCAGDKGGPAADAPANSNRWVFGIEKPIVSRTAAPILYRMAIPGDSALATSGNARNFSVADGRRFSHIIDPRTGKPTEIHPETGSYPKKEPGSVSVFDSSCARADALATALFVLGPDDGIALADRLEIPVLYIFRSTDPDDSTTTERTSAKFTAIDSTRVGEK